MTVTDAMVSAALGALSSNIHPGGCDCAACRMSMRAALEAAQAAAWQPIESAPREPLNHMGEGPTILLLGTYSSNGGPETVRTGHWKAARTNAWCDTELGRCPYQPKAWMPLPKSQEPTP
jgi:hypothetical protein